VEECNGTYTLIGRNGRVEGCNRHELHVPALQLPHNVHRALLVNIDWLLSCIKSQNKLLTEKSDTVIKITIILKTCRW